ncbi:hypothetical protein Y1Q_0001965 [Alligator mississippiensis]|uniref:Uncharacterized protein n=1 Tax=Alligator mississippiensis TaxID=8496 RepID=A0A151PHB2_ALLMI|nr:hypothetical protein Y1Q_0001965 [Alligator mississippiensis]
MGKASEQADSEDCIAHHALLQRLAEAQEVVPSTRIQAAKLMAWTSHTPTDKTRLWFLAHAHFQSHFIKATVIAREGYKSPRFSSGSVFLQKKQKMWLRKVSHSMPRSYQRPTNMKQPGHSYLARSAAKEQQ